MYWASNVSELFCKARGFRGILLYTIHELVAAPVDTIFVEKSSSRR